MAAGTRPLKTAASCSSVVLASKGVAPLFRPILGQMMLQSGSRHTQRHPATAWSVGTAAALFTIWRFPRRILKPGIIFFLLTLIFSPHALADGAVPKVASYCSPLIGVNGAFVVPPSACADSLRDLAAILQGRITIPCLGDSCTSIIFSGGAIYLRTCFWQWTGPTAICGNPILQLVFYTRYLACPAFSTISGSQCICNVGFAFAGETQACVPRFDVDNTSKPGLCRTRVGDPIDLFTGVEHYESNIGLSLFGLPLTVTYDTSRRAPTSIADIDHIDVEIPAFGSVWYGSWHKQLTLGVSNTGVRISRGNGDYVSFRQTPTGAFFTDADVPGRLVRTGNGFTYIDLRAGSVEQYNSAGALVRIDFSDGRGATFSYSDSQTPASIAPASGYLVGVQDDFGRLASIEYDLPSGNAGSDGRVRSISSQGNIVHFDYTSANLAKIRWADGTELGFSYERADLPWALTGITDERSVRFATITYDLQGRAIGSFLSGNVDRYSLAFSQAPSITTVDEYISSKDVVIRTRTWSTPQTVDVALPLGTQATLGAINSLGTSRVSKQSQPAGSGCSASTSNQSYDQSGNIASSDDFNGSRTCFSYDTSNREVVRIEGLAAGKVGTACASVSAGSGIPAGSRKVSTEWHPDWRLRARVAEPGRITTSVYNGQPDSSTNGAASCAPADAILPGGKPIAVLCKQVEQATTDATGVLGLSAAIDTAVLPRVVRWTYNRRGQVLTQTDPLGNTTTYAYHLKTAFSGTDPYAEGHTIGDLATVIGPATPANPQGLVTNYTSYNKSGQVLQVTDPNGVANTYTYDMRQRLISSTVAGQTTLYAYWANGLLKKVTQPDGAFVTYIYDDAHRLTKLSDSLGNSLTYTLDNSGNRTGEQVRDPNNILRRVLSRSIDALGRVQQVTGRE